MRHWSDYLDYEAGNVIAGLSGRSYNKRHERSNYFPKGADGSAGGSRNVLVVRLRALGLTAVLRRLAQGN